MRKWDEFSFFSECLSERECRFLAHRVLLGFCFYCYILAYEETRFKRVASLEWHIRSARRQTGGAFFTTFCAWYWAGRLSFWSSLFNQGWSSLKNTFSLFYLTAENSSVFLGNKFRHFFLKFNLCYLPWTGILSGKKCLDSNKKDVERRERIAPWVVWKEGQIPSSSQKDWNAVFSPKASRCQR